MGEALNYSTPTKVTSVATSQMSIIERSRRYVEKTPGAVSGQNGHDHTFWLACKIIHEIGCTQTEALEVLHVWNRNCQPPWSNKELEHKVRDAARGHGSHSVDAPRGRTVSSQAFAGQTRANIELTNGTDEDLCALGLLRKIGLEGLRWAVRRGILRFGNWHGHRVWAVTDQSNRITELRRLDGQPFPAVGSLNVRKSHTLKGGQKAWPIGIIEAERFPCVALYEGAPDLLAGHYQVIWEQLPSHQLLGHEDAHVTCAPVAMMSASPAIHEDALSYFKGKHVRITGHGDEAGWTAVRRWKIQIEKAGAAKVDFVDLGKIRLKADFTDVVGELTERVLPGGGVM